MVRDLDETELLNELDEEVFQAYGAAATFYDTDGNDYPGILTIPSKDRKVMRGESNVVDADFICLILNKNLPFQVEALDRMLLNNQYYELIDHDDIRSSVNVIQVYKLFFSK